MWLRMYLCLCVFVLWDGFRGWASQRYSFAENVLEAHWPPNRSILAAPGEVAAAVLVGGARETPGSAAAGVGAAAAGEGAASAASGGSDSKESPISASGVGVFQIPPSPKKGSKRNPEGATKMTRGITEVTEERKKKKNS